jgi:hypothetical protein
VDEVPFSITKEDGKIKKKMASVTGYKLSVNVKAK